MELLDLMLKRRSIRAYKDEKIEDDKLDKIIKAGMLAPSSRNGHAGEMILVRDKEVLKALADIKPGSAAMIAGADCAVVVIGNREKTDVWMEDSAIIMTQMHLMATDQGVGSCWVQCRGRKHADGRTCDQVARDLLAYPEAYELESILALGMPAEEKPAYDPDHIKGNQVHWDKF